MLTPSILSSLLSTIVLGTPVGVFLELSIDKWLKQDSWLVILICCFIATVVVPKLLSPIAELVEVKLESD